MKEKELRGIMKPITLDDMISNVVPTEILIHFNNQLAINSASKLERKDEKTYVEREEFQVVVDISANLDCR